MGRVLVLCVLAVAAPQLISADGGAAAQAAAPAASNKGPNIAEAQTPTAAFDAQGRLWAAWVQGTAIMVASSGDKAKTFTPAVRVTRENEEIDANGEARPKIAVGRDGDVYVTWTRKGAKPYTGDIRFSSSRDGGKTFSPPVTLNDDKLEIGHRFDALYVNRAGHVYVAWIDKRDLERATARGEAYEGAALYYTVSLDRGRTFAANKKIKDYICECCRLAIDFDARDLPVMVWRDVIDGTTRDHGIVRFDSAAAPAAPGRATRDGWKINACPHHGPSLSIAGDGTHHMTWFTGEGPQGAGSFYARSTDGGKTFTPPMKVSEAGATMHAAAHAVVLSHGPRVVLAWRGVESGDDRPLYVRESGDGGKTWTAPRVLIRMKGHSDHPFLLKDGATFYLSWFSHGDGYRLLALGGATDTTRTARGRQ